jgi:glycosyltransferase involved in cell wall biosynthesis
MKGLLATFPDQVDDAALAAFDDAYPGLAFAPVVVLIAAYNEADTVGEVLRRVPRDCLGLAVDTLVVVDGATDDTAAVARRDERARVCEVPVNRGQGAALRLGYQLAARYGASYVVTTDADGQYDVEQLPLLLTPLFNDTADFVTGSRVLGGQETGDLVRRAGTRVFAALVSLLTRQHVTDTSFGLRSMRVEVAAGARLEQPQYQSSELLISILARRQRVLEVPMVIRRRGAGRSKKGNNLVYGVRYARVVLRTWWRERRPANTSPSKSRNLTTNMTP